MKRCCMERILPKATCKYIHTFMTTCNGVFHWWREGEWGRGGGGGVNVGM